LRLLRGQVEPAGVALVEPVLDDVQHLPVELEQVLRGIELRLQRGDLHRGVHDVGAERDPRGDELVADGVLLRGQRFDRAPVQPEHVRHVGHAHLRGEQVV
jgi:hypothetical protein